MATPRDFKAELRQIKNDILSVIERQMQRIGRTVSKDDGIEFFAYSNVCDWLIYIQKDGLIITDVGPRDFDQYLDEGIIGIEDISDLVEQLRAFEKQRPNNHAEHVYTELVANHCTEVEILETLCDKCDLSIKEAYQFLKNKTPIC